MILSNQVQCLHCGADIFSRHRHDFVSCDCEDQEKQVCVDGGMDYLRRVHGTRANYVDNSLTVSQDTYDAIVEAIEDPTKSTLGRVCNLARVLRNKEGIYLRDGDTSED